MNKSPKTLPRPALAVLALAVLALAVIASVLTAAPSLAQSIAIDLGAGGGSATNRLVQLVALTTVLSLAPGILLMVTSFTRIVIVLSLVRTAIGVQQAPPNQVLISLALFLTFFIMMPTLERAWDDGISPYINEEIDENTAFERTVEPFHDFMMNNVRQKDVQLFLDIAGITDEELAERVPLRVLIPSFMISEFRRAFEMGFLIFVPFLIIDMVVASVLMAMGMMMLPPVIVALPFKIIFFVLIDGWYMLAGSLVRSFS